MTKPKIKQIYIHHSAIDRDKQPNQFIMINLYHKQKWNFKSSLGKYGGYTYIIEPNGRLKRYREDGEEQAAQKGHNLNSISICLAGNFDEQKPTFEQEIRLRTLLHDKLEEYELKPEDIILHREVRPTSCPGKNVTRAYILKLVQDDYLEETKVVILKKLIVMYKKIIQLLWKKSKEG